MGWCSEKSVKELPARVGSLFSKEASSLLIDLRYFCLDVILMSAPEPKFIGHMIRVAVNQNPLWYRELYATTLHFRRDRTLRSLNRIANRVDCNLIESSSAVRLQYTYDYLFREIIFRRLTEGYIEESGFVPPRRAALEFFDISYVAEDAIPF